MPRISSRAEIRRVLAATYHQVWWPNVSEVKYYGDQLPVWDEATGTYVDPATGEVLSTWDQALDAIGPEDEPWHVARFGTRFDAQGVPAGSKDTARCIGYLTKYLTKQVGECHQVETDAQRAHAARLAEALRYQPCSPTCANWFRYGIQPKNHRNRYLSSLVSDWMRGVGLIVVSGQGVSQVTHSYRAAGVVAARDGGAVSDRGRQRLRAW